jgi:hypothetical protein
VQSVEVIGVSAVVPILLFLVVIVAVAVAANRGANGPRSPLRSYALFLLGVSFATLVMLVVSTGIATHAVSNLIGPTPVQNVDVSTVPAGATNSPTDIPVPPPAGGAIGSYRTTVASDRQDQRNHDITEAVIAGLFALSAAVGYGLAWRRAKTLPGGLSADREVLGRLPLSYAYLIAGLAALAVLVLAPLSASALFRAIAPGVNGTSGHADGLRKLATFGVVLALSVWILQVHLRLTTRLRAGLSTGDNSQSPPAGSQSS